MNNFNVVGRLTKKPELTYTKENKAITKMNIAIRNGKEDTTFLTIKVFGKQAGNIEKYCDKGSQLAVNGIIRNNNYEDDKGNKHYEYDFIGLGVEFLSNKSNDTSKEEKPQETPKKEVFDNTQEFADFGNFEDYDEEIVF